MTRLVITPKFKRVYRKFTKGDLATRKRIDDAIEQMQIDPFAPPTGIAQTAQCPVRARG